MSWIDGTHLVVNKTSSSDLPIIEKGIKSTLNQLLVKGVLHADPHAGNILKTDNGKLAYLDFGLVAEVPEGVREALVCGVMYLIEKNYSALALEFDSLMLMPPEDLKRDRKEFTEALEKVVSKILEYPNITSASGTKLLPVLRFDSIVSSLFAVAMKFNFVVPPYFLNNARAIASLEGMALSGSSLSLHLHFLIIIFS
jgi:predicted unusual protein kinase regulating ubiquinone biosynthesis (AarF/ABC1/UbiB family)